jgi:hypothetical protein
MSNLNEDIERWRAHLAALDEMGAEGAWGASRGYLRACLAALEGLRAAPEAVEKDERPPDLAALLEAARKHERVRLARRLSDIASARRRSAGEQVNSADACELQEQAIGLEEAEEAVLAEPVPGQPYGCRFALPHEHTAGCGFYDPTPSWSPPTKEGPIEKLDAPCPFCGDDHGYVQTEFGEGIVTGQPRESHVVICRSCAAWGPWSKVSKAGAHERWNARAKR